MIRVYTAKHCRPCHQIVDILKELKPKDIELVDIETDEGFLKFSEEVLNHGDGVVPSAFKNGKECKIILDEERSLLSFDCPNVTSSSE